MLYVQQGVIMKKIILCVRYPLTNKAPETIVVPVETLQENLWEICRKACPSARYFSFDRYYGKSDLMTLGRMFPYILRDDAFVWNVPYSEVTVEEFLDTHGLTEQDMIQVEVDNVGSASELLMRLYQEWVSFSQIAVQAIDWIGRGLTVYSIVKWVWTSFGKRKEEKPQVKEFYDFLLRRKRWNMKVLAKQLNTDEQFLKSMLEVVGFENMGNGNYIFSDVKNEKFKEICLSYQDSWQDNHGTTVNCYGINEEVFLLNRNMLYLQILCSEIQTVDVWKTAQKRIQEFVYGHSDCLLMAGDEGTICLKEYFQKDFENAEEMELWSGLHNLNTYLDEKIWPLEELLEQKT